MGAVAISALAGSTLLLHAQEWILIGELLPFIKGFTLFFWAIATWWIPLLLLLMAWRHLWKRHPIRYDPRYWGMAFPLAMYTTATFQLASAEHLDFLMIVPEGFLVAASLIWVLAFLGLLRSIGRAIGAAMATQDPRVAQP
jgi:tellurite resistance protein TehA-like permease